MTKIEYTQNFLKSHSLVSELINASKIEEGDTVIEIGSGKGIITECLVEKVGTSGLVVALEIDKVLSDNLAVQFTNVPQVKILNVDARNYNFGKHTPYKVFSNIPFMYTSDLMNVLLDVNTGAEVGYVIVQRESALMYGGTELGSESTLKSLLAIPNYSFSVFHHFSKSDFVPSPQVDTVLLGFSKREKTLVSQDEYEVYADFLAFTSGDRVGEGSWKKLFSKSDLATLSQKGLVLGRGLRLQTTEAIIFAFHYLIQHYPEKWRVTVGSMSKLHKQQSELVKNRRTRVARNWKTG
jgi:23S rRNA (adenine-N6)-dimethyltransferase